MLLIFQPWMFGPWFACHLNHLEGEAVLILLHSKNECKFTPNVVVGELQLVWVKPFNCLKSSVLFDCIGPENK